jgi:hypothetical protein
VKSRIDDSHGYQVRWSLRARNSTCAIRQRRAFASWIIDLVSTGRLDGKPFHHVHSFITTLSTSPKALLRLVQQRWAIENSVALALDVLNPTWRGRPSLRPAQWGTGVGSAEENASESAALQWFSLSSRWLDGRSARHQLNARLGPNQSRSDGMMRLSVSLGLETDRSILCSN